MNNKVINKCIYTSQYKYKTGIIGIIGGIVLSIIVLFLCYCILFIKDNDIKISFSLPGVKNKCYSISNIRLIYKLDNELITLWIDKIFSTEKKIYKDTIIKLLKKETFDIFYLKTSKLITNPLQIEKIINSYIK